jgi:hypothetical protein
MNRFVAIKVLTRLESRCGIYLKLWVVYVLPSWPGATHIKEPAHTHTTTTTAHTQHTPLNPTLSLF